MALVMSTDIENVKVQAFGNWFDFKPGQIKNMQPEIARFLTVDKKEYGFVSLPDTLEDEDRNSEVFKQAVAEATTLGRNNIIAKLSRLRHNIEVSMKRDMEMANIKADPFTYVDDKKSAIAMYKKLAKFKDLESESTESELDELRQLKDKIDGNANGADA